jgi:hypothetical protein
MTFLHGPSDRLQQLGIGELDQVDLVVHAVTAYQSSST